MMPTAESGSPTPRTTLKPQVTPSSSPTIVKPLAGTSSAQILPTKSPSSGVTASTPNTGSIFDKQNAFPPEPLLPGTSVSDLESYSAAAYGPHFDYPSTVPWRSWDELPEPEKAPESEETRLVRGDLRRDRAPHTGYANRRNHLPASH